MPFVCDRLKTYFNLKVTLYYLYKRLINGKTINLIHSLSCDNNNMAKERGIFQLIWKNFIASLKPQYLHRKLVGEDYYGTKYYEQEIRNSSRKRPPRYFVPVNKDDFEQEKPAEWESWLRYRRKDPPTQEEIETNYKLAMTKKQNATKLIENSKNESTKDLPTSVSSATTPGSFPVYEDYKNFGSGYKPKDVYK